MSKTIEVKIPDLGGAEKVDVVEVLVEPGQRIERDAGLVTLESDKASMDAPSPAAGTVREIAIKRGDKVSEGDLILTLEVEEDTGSVGTAKGEKKRSSAKDHSSEAPARPDSEASASEQREGKPAEARARSSAPAGAVDLVVLGAGPGGYTAAFRAADLGLKVVLIERYPTLGGVCLNVGCIPSKALLHSAKVIDEAAAMKEHGIAFGSPTIDRVKLARFKQGVVDRLTGGLRRLSKQRKIEVVHGTATLTSAHGLRVALAAGGQREIAFAKAILAAGSRPIQIPGIPYGDERVMDSTGALDLAEIPKRLLVIGGGIIGLEMATIYSALGSKVTVVELTEGLIPGCDRDLVKPLERRLRDHYGVDILLATKVAGVKANQKSLSAELVADDGDKSRRARFDRVLVAVGRRPNGDRIGAEAAGVEVDEKGFVVVDQRQRTNVEHIFAIGDLVGPPLLAHKASHQGKVAAEVAAGRRSAFDARVIPSVAYTDPEIAWAGLSESEAEERGIEIEKASIPWAVSGRALGMGRDDGLTKLLFNPASRRIVGGGIVGVNAGDLISEVALAIEMGATAGDVALTIHPHPTLSETVAFAAEAYDGSITDLYLPKRKR